MESHAIYFTNGTELVIVIFFIADVLNGCSKSNFIIGYRRHGHNKTVNVRTVGLISTPFLSGNFLLLVYKIKRVMGSVMGSDGFCDLINNSTM